MLSSIYGILSMWNKQNRALSGTAVHPPHPCSDAHSKSESDSVRARKRSHGSGCPWGLLMWTHTQNWTTVTIRLVSQMLESLLLQ